MKSKTTSDDFEAMFWKSGAEVVVREEADDNRVYDLEERTARFGEMVIEFANLERIIPFSEADRKL